MNKFIETSDLLVLSQHRWDFVYQRPHHILSRYAKHRRVFYFEAPVYSKIETPRLLLRETSEGVIVVVPHLSNQIHPLNVNSAMRDLIDELICDENVNNYTLWYYDVNALTYSDHLEPTSIVYDCTDEVELNPLELELLKLADVVFTGSHALYEERKKHHFNIHPFPSSVDVNLFDQARQQLVEPENQLLIPRPRIGFYGVIDERFDSELLAELAAIKPEYQFVILGPIINREKNSLPLGHNIHYLGKKDYHSLPLYLAGWDCTILPYKMDETTNFCTTNNTPEFLTAGKPVVSTSLKDVINPYGNARLVYIADNSSSFISSIDLAMNERQYDPEWLERVDAFFESNSWDNTYEAMAELEATHRAEKYLAMDVNLMQKIPSSSETRSFG